MCSSDLNAFPDTIKNKVLHHCLLLDIDCNGGKDFKSLAGGAVSMIVLIFTKEGINATASWENYS